MTRQAWPYKAVILEIWHKYEEEFIELIEIVIENVLCTGNVTYMRLRDIFSQLSSRTSNSTSRP